MFMMARNSYADIHAKMHAMGRKAEIVLNIDWALLHAIIILCCSSQFHLHDAGGDGDGPRTINLKLLAPIRSTSEPLKSLRWLTSPWR